MAILEVKNLCKKYPNFVLDNVSFSLEKGKITGFIGRNGAGKSTTIKSIFDFVHPDSGEVEFFDMPFDGNQNAIKSRVGLVSGGVNYYGKSKIKKITEVTKAFYPDWDDSAYQGFLSAFNLDEKKTPEQLSAGMRVKYSVALALSHNAELLILDEPTSGLDPVSRDDLLETFLDLSDKGVTILFSTHIITDLEKCADNIIYIHNGKILCETTLKSFSDSYRLVEYAGEDSPSAVDEPLLIGYKRSKDGHTAIIRSEDAPRLSVPTTAVDLETVMVHLEKEDKQ